MVSIEDVALKAGVSIATVSRVLNGTGYVSEETELKVLKAIKELGYKPHFSAQALARKRSFEVGVIISRRIQEILPTEIGIFYKIILEAIENASVMYKISVELMLLDEWDFKIHHDGYIIVGSDATEEQITKLSSKAKVVLVDHYIDGLRVNSIVSDGYDGVFFITKELIHKGFNRIVHLHGPLKYYGFRDRYNGYVSAMSRFGKLPITYEYDDLHEDVDNVLRKVLRDWIPEAIICSNDVIAIRTLKKLREWEYKVPEDISVIGFDDIPAAEREGLSTFRVQKSELGMNAVKRMYELLTGQSLHPYKQCLYTLFVKRNSSK
ncbi:MAG: LacI family transcriptional regulator [Fervidobacterium sp.]|nr:LacI family transcriptional regulator [Fervidobacterium sp.]